MPAIATVEWHPFSISSAPADGARRSTDHASHPLRRRRELHRTPARAARSIDGDGDALASLVVNADGPYGTPRAESFLALGAVDAGRAHHLLLIAGGIGVTPLHSAFRGLYHVAYCQRLPAGYRPDRLSGVGEPRRRALRIADARTLDEIDEALGGRFSYRLHCTGHADEEAPSAKARVGARRMPAPAARDGQPGGPTSARSSARSPNARGAWGACACCGPRALADACRAASRGRSRRRAAARVVPALGAIYNFTCIFGAKGIRSGLGLALPQCGGG